MQFSMLQRQQRAITFMTVVEFEAATLALDTVERQKGKVLLPG
jgi:hypothetical protein